MLEDYKQPAPRTMLAEIKKRGTVQQRKDPTTNTVKKNVAQKQRTSSPVGWGAVPDTFPKLKKGFGRTISLNVAQIVYMNAVPPAAEPPTKRLKAIVPEEIELPTVVRSEKVVVPAVLAEWYKNIGANYEKGATGFVPEPYIANGLPGTLDEYLETNVGQILLNFCKYIKRLF